MITLATAHPAKFPDAVEEASGIHPPLPARMADLYESPERVTRIANDLAALRGSHQKEHRQLTVQQHTLANGFRIVTEHMPGLQSAALGIWVERRRPP